MDISTPTVVVDGNKATVYAVVAPLARTGKNGATVIKPIVQFSLDGKGQKPGPTDESGLASIELDNLKIGDHTVNATVLGQSPPVMVTADFEITGKTRQPTGTFGRTMMALFWAVTLFAKLLLGFGPGIVLTGTYLVLTMIVLLLISRSKEVSFGSVVGNNNWVCGANFGMFVLSAIMASFNPLLPESVGGGWLNWLWSETELSDSVLWGVINGWFFQESFTFGWNDATTWFALGIVPSALVSYLDELTGLGGKWTKHHAHGGGLADFVVEHLVGEALVQTPAKAILKLLGWGK